MIIGSPVRVKDTGIESESCLE